MSSHFSLLDLRDACQFQFTRVMAAHEMALLDFPQFGRFGRAAVVVIIEATGVEVAAARRVGRVGHISFQHYRLGPVAGVRLRHRGQQRFGIRMLGIAVEYLRARALHKHTHIHHRNAVADVLDELNKPYVETARAKGVKERNLIWKYPTRVALNPFFSTVGWSLAELISGTTIVAIVLSLQTTGPMLFTALINQDMFLAGSFIMLLSVLTVIGTLLSDLLLAWIDPRIRLEEMA